MKKFHDFIKKSISEPGSLSRFINFRTRREAFLQQPCRILEKESIVSIGTSHSQTIGIILKDGSSYRGKYIQKEAGRYSKDPHLFDILNLVLYIKKQRPPDEVRQWRIICE